MLATLKSSTTWKTKLAWVRQALKTNYTKELVTTSLHKVKIGWRSLYCRVEVMNQSTCQHNKNTRRNPMTRDNQFFSRGSRACRHATSPLCRPTLGGSAAKRCCTNLIHTIGHRKNLPTSEVTQWHKQFTKVTFWHSIGEGTTPLTITGDGHEQSPTRANPPPLLQAV